MFYLKITKVEISVADLVQDYTDKGDDGVFAYGGKLAVRPAYQREFVYKDVQRNAVIETIRKGFPLNVIYWNRTGEDTYEVLDGQQRTISICQYVTGVFSINVNGNARYFHNLSVEEQQQILGYKLDVYICVGTSTEKLEWFKIINIAGEVLTPQELLNATYAGTWLSCAKIYFSKTNCVAKKFADGYVKGNPIRQELLETVLGWITKAEGLKSIGDYMALHQQDTDADALWFYFQEVISWAKRMFPIDRVDKKLLSVQDWGALYAKYGQKKYVLKDIYESIENLLADEEVTKQTGIIPYVLSERTHSDERLLSLRAFPEQIKRRVWNKQNKQCPLCLKEGITKQYAFEEMQGDHIVPWCAGGKTVEENLQMLCKKCNNTKSAT